MDKLIYKGREYELVEVEQDRFIVYVESKDSVDLSDFGYMQDVDWGRFPDKPKPQYVRWMCNSIEHGK
jgi:hypothetical protein